MSCCQCWLRRWRCSRINCFIDFLAFKIGAHFSLVIFWNVASACILFHSCFCCGKQALFNISCEEAFMPFLAQGRNSVHQMKQAMQIRSMPLCICVCVCGLRVAEMICWICNMKWKSLKMMKFPVAHSTFHPLPIYYHILYIVSSPFLPFLGLYCDCVFFGFSFLSFFFFLH